MQESSKRPTVTVQCTVFLQSLPQSAHWHSLPGLYQTLHVIARA